MDDAVSLQSIASSTSEEFVVVNGDGPQLKVPAHVDDISQEIASAADHESVRSLDMADMTDMTDSPEDKQRRVGSENVSNNGIDDSEKQSVNTREQSCLAEKQSGNAEEHEAVDELCDHVIPSSQSVDESCDHVMPSSQSVDALGSNSLIENYPDVSPSGEEDSKTGWLHSFVDSL